MIFHKMIFTAAITLYHPTEEQLDRIKDYSKSFDAVFLFDNTEHGNRYHLYLPDNFVYISEGDNKGLPYAFNVMLKKSFLINADYMCMLDQDSIFLENDIARMKTDIEGFLDERKIGVIGPFVNYGSERNKKAVGIVGKKWVITSGAFINIKNAIEQGINFDENYFIDKFEIDLCQHFLKKGFLVLMNYDAVLYQSLGEKNRKGYSEHSATRHYYIFRNRYYFNNKWFGFWKKNFLNVLQTIKHIWRIRTRESDYKSKIAMRYAAKKDYKNGIFGKYKN